MAALAPRKFSTKVREASSRRATSCQSFCTSPFTIGSTRGRIVSGATCGSNLASAGSRLARRWNRVRRAFFDARRYASLFLNCATVKRPEPAPSHVSSPVRRNRSMTGTDKPSAAAPCSDASRMHRLTALNLSFSIFRQRAAPETQATEPPRVTTTPAPYHRYAAKTRTPSPNASEK